MIVASSSVQLAATHVSERVSTRRESFQVWVGDEPTRGGAARAGGPPDGAASRAALAARLRAAAPAQAVARPLVESGDAAPPEAEGRAPGEAEAEAEERTRGTPRDELDLAILMKTFRLGRRLTSAAHEVRNAYADGARAAGDARAQLDQAGRPAAGPPEGAPPREGWGLRHDLTETSVELEQTRFAASARVTTADGRTIDVQAALEMTRLEASTREVHVTAGDGARKVDPLVLNLAGAPAAFQGSGAFDLDADGAREQVATLAPGSAYLAMDRNGNGAIDSGAELFGPSTGSGFGELAALDGDGNGWVDEGDQAFRALALWSPASGALSPLAAAGVGALYTGSAATPFQVKSGGLTVASVAETGLFLREDGTAGTVQHVDLVA